MVTRLERVMSVKSELERTEEGFGPLKSLIYGTAEPYTRLKQLADLDSSIAANVQVNELAVARQGARPNRWL